MNREHALATVGVWPLPQRRTLAFGFLNALILQFTLTDVWAVDVLARAVVGQPYGVATVDIPVGVPVIGREYPPIEVSDQSGRVLFQVANDVRVEVGLPSDRPLPPPGGGRLLSRVGELVRELAGDGEPERQTVSRRVSFLFTGSTPMRVRLGDINGSFGTYEIIPQVDPGSHAPLLQEWWNGYTEVARRKSNPPTTRPSWRVTLSRCWRRVPGCRFPIGTLRPIRRMTSLSIRSS